MSSQTQNVAATPPPPLQTPLVDKVSAIIIQPWLGWINWVWTMLRKQPVTITTLAGLPTNLQKTDAGLTYWDAQLQHMYQWTGSAWIFAPGDDNLAGMILPSAGGGVPLAGVWHVCDGTVVAVSKGDGTTTNITTPNLSGNTFIQGAAAQSAVVAATSPTWAAGAKTDDEATHSHPVSITSSGESADVIFQAGTGASTNAAADPHTHSVTGNTGAGTAHHHNLSNANAVINPPSAANSGLPQNIALVFYIRR